MEKRRPSQWWRKHYDNYLLSKLSINQYSIDNNINKSTFYHWIKKFREIEPRDENSNAEVLWATLNPDLPSDPVSLNPKEKTTIKITIDKATIEIITKEGFKFINSIVKDLIENAQ